MSIADPLSAKGGDLVIVAWPRGAIDSAISFLYIHAVVIWPAGLQPR